MKTILNVLYWPIAISLALVAIMWRFQFSPFGDFGFMINYMVLGYYESLGDSSEQSQLVVGAFLVTILVTYPIITYFEYKKSVGKRKSKLVISILLSLLAITFPFFIN